MVAFMALLSSTVPTDQSALAARRRQDWLSPGVVGGIVVALDLCAIVLSGLLAHQGDVVLPDPRSWFGVAFAGLLALNLFKALVLLCHELLAD